jgi:hypothetical protein
MPPTPYLTDHRPVIREMQSGARQIQGFITVVRIRAMQTQGVIGTIYRGEP